ncbi:bile acid:sodium symporter [Komagataeibacter rhaeticus]|uniref:bile acid:sodium symporter family protein n=1 Tax=Komagataeibacter rhaeticus TaxID=215221 RepID=UPI0004D72380|nr:bile acid:sodium symporter family protein [Komagataeibacter rhaeticus]KDU94636.1 bile acid:sodium symporter [Komagataeibacter rhaeticus AF1]MBL7240256.1 bile acid:sodium symporter [Komagataeibacter rhaeticus]PYD53711.1 bile acid:sodium symporter [Komagataeibacter rhaeticus]GBQ10988.1 bile acid/Na+ symporter [Komagataeibacter rhaeticus DSM 16663]
MFRKLDSFLLCLLATVTLASVVPCRGAGVGVFNMLALIMIANMFFLQGARLSRRAVVEGMMDWRIHLAIGLCTFALFPLLGMGLHALVPGLLDGPMWTGVLFLCCLPSTVQSSIAFTSIARGSVAAAICSATLSNILGIFLTPLLVGLVLARHAAAGGGGIGPIVLQLLVPFIAGQVAQPWIGAWAHRHRKLLSFSDRGSILVVVYTAFSEAVVQGLWHRLPPMQLARVALVDMLILAIVLGLTRLVGRMGGFGRADRVAILFCGSKKSLASGVPIASVLFAHADVGLIVLPVMIYHQIQLFVCATLARRLGAQAEGTE